jgi:hypothetical protein
VTDDTAGTSLATTTAAISATSGASKQSATPSTFFAIGPAANASSQFAYVLSPLQSGGSSLTIETIDNSTGALTPTGITPPSLDANFSPAGMLTDPSRKFLYLYGGNSVQSFSIASTSGALIPSGTATTNNSSDISANQALTFTPAGNFAFFITQNPNATNTVAPGTVTRFSVDSNTGSLGAIETISAQVQNPQVSAIDPNGKYLYISGFAPSTSTAAVSAAPQIAIFAVAAGTSALTPISESPLAIESGFAAASMAIDSTGRFIYAAGINSSTNSAALSVFSISSATGALTQSVAPTQLVSPASLGQSATAATSLILSPANEKAYVLATLTARGAMPGEAIQQFALNTQTGVPTFASSTGTKLSSAPANFLMTNLVMFSPVHTTTNTSGPGFLFLTNPPYAAILLFSVDGETAQVNYRAATKIAGQ